MWPVLQRLRLLFCCFDFVPTASMLSRRVTYYIKALSGRFDISLLCIKGAEHPHIERYEKARIMRVPLKPGTLEQRQKQFERALRRQLESEEYAVVHCFDFVGGRVLAELKQQLGYRLVFEATTLSSQEWPHSHPEFALCANTLENIQQEEMNVALHANAIVVATAQQKRFLCSQGLGHLPVHLLLNPSLPRKGISAQPVGCFQFLHLGGSSQPASLQTTLHAFKTISPELKIQLAFGGHYGAQDKAYLTAWRETLNTQKAVVWPNLKQETETGALCAKAHAALLVLENEPRNVNFGGAMPELADFFAWGLPIVASDLPCVREFLGEGDALFFKPGDSAMLAKRMEELALSAQLQARLALACAHKASAFAPARFIYETSRLYYPWMEKPSPLSEQLLEPLPEFTPSMARTASASLPFYEPDTLIVPPAFASSPPE